MLDEYCQADAIRLGELVRRRELSARELVEAAIESIERVNPELNAVVLPLYEQARRRADALLPTGSALAGVPMLLKDLLSPLAGVPFTSGSRYYKDLVADCDAEMVLRYRRAGLSIVGKTNTPEFGIMPVTEPVLFGACKNPWDTGRTPGGSSGGAAAAVASGMVPVAHGGDGGGSIRIPAACCGLFGLKPTRGRNPAGPHQTEHWFGLAAEHVLTRSVRDSAAMLDISAGPEPTSPYHAPVRERPFLEEVGLPPRKLRIAFTDQPHLPARVHADCKRALRDAALLLEDLGHEVVEATPELNPEPLAEAFFTIVCGSVAAAIRTAELETGQRPQRHQLELATWLAGMLGNELTAGDAFAAWTVLHAQARSVHRFFEEHDVLLTPTLGSPPLAIGELEPRGAEALAQRTIANFGLGSILKLRRVIKRTVGRIFGFVPFTPLANITGQPSMSVPLYWNQQGLPIGTSFTARFGEEGLLFRLAGQLEAARPWAHRLPNVHVLTRTPELERRRVLGS